MTVVLVALTGYAMPEDLQRAADAGFRRHLAKPPTTEAIEEALSRFPREVLGRMRRVSDRAGSRLRSRYRAAGRAAPALPLRRDCFFAPNLDASLVHGPEVSGAGR